MAMKIQPVPFELSKRQHYPIAPKPVERYFTDSNGQVLIEKHYNAFETPQLKQ